MREQRVLLRLLNLEVAQLKVAGPQVYRLIRALEEDAVDLAQVALCLRGQDLVD